MKQPANKGNGKRLAKNAALMYVRMIVLMFISLFTARVVLKQLGVEDFGIYNVVGSILAMFNSLRAIFSSSTQRYLNYEMGRNSLNNLKKIFKVSLCVNAIISIIVFIVVECVGVWFIENKINVPDSRFYATHVVFQFSVISTIISIFTTTFDAEIIAHERMNFYAYLSIFEGFLKLVIVYALLLTPLDRLITYGALLLLVQVGIFVISCIYCKRDFEEVSLSENIDKSYLKEMTKFAGWNFFGNTAFAFSQNVLNMTLNIFGGPLVNAARGISYQVKSFLDQFVNNVLVVVKPYAIKLYAADESSHFFEVIFIISKLLFLIQGCLSLLMVFYTREFLLFWLGQVPDYSILFVQLIMMWTLVRSLHNPVDIVFMANGNLKYYQLAEFVILTAPILISYISLKLGAGYHVVYTSMIICELIDLFSITIIAKKQCKFPLSAYFKNVVFPCLYILIIGVFGFVIMNKYFNDNILYKTTLIFFIFAIMITVSYYKCSSMEKYFLLSIFQKYVKRQ